MVTFIHVFTFFSKGSKYIFTQMSYLTKLLYIYILKFMNYFNLVLKSKLIFVLTLMWLMYQTNAISNRNLLLMLQHHFSGIFSFLISHMICLMTKNMIKHILGYLVLPIIIKVIENYKILFHFLLKLWLVY